MKFYRVYFEYGFSGTEPEEVFLSFEDNEPQEKINKACEATLQELLSELDQGYDEVTEKEYENEEVDDDDEV